MGIEGFYKFIHKNIPDIYVNKNIYGLKGKIIIIDGMQHIYSQILYMRMHEKEIINNGKNITHIHGLLNSLLYYLDHGIVPIFIFDGKSPELKKNKVNERKKQLKANINKLRELKEIKDLNILNEMKDIKDDNDFIVGTPPVESLIDIDKITDEYNKLHKKTIILKDYFIQDWMDILDMLGLPYIKADGEADPLCAYIMKSNKHIFSILSDDSDMMIFGASSILKKTKNQFFSILYLDKILDGLTNLIQKLYNKNTKFELDNLIDFAILLGTDYGTFTINNLITSDSLELFKMYIDNNMNYKMLIKEEDYERFEEIKQYYKSNDKFNNYPNCDISEYLTDKIQNLITNKPKWNTPNFELLKSRLLELDVESSYINYIINTYNSKFEKYMYHTKFKYYKYGDNSYYHNNKYNKTDDSENYNTECLFNMD